MSGVIGAQEGRKAYLILMVIVNCKIVALPTTSTRQGKVSTTGCNLQPFIYKQFKKNEITLLFVLKVQKFPSKNLKSFRGRWPPAHQLMRNYGGSSQSYQNTISLALYLCPLLTRFSIIYPLTINI